MRPADTPPDQSPPVRVVAVEFRNYKALKQFSLKLQRTNILIGPNNCGKSTIVGVFKALSTALRRAKGKAPVVITGPEGRRYGHWVSAESLPISIENVHSDYAEADTTITFEFSNRNALKLYFPKDGTCALLAETMVCLCAAQASFARRFHSRFQ
jgi:energy-coupling factor transporter ATP-binding protein EcfA2